MRDYSATSLEELMKEYSALASDPLVKAYLEVSDELMERKKGYPSKPETEFYRAACGYEYTIELPYDELSVGSEKAWVEHHDCSFRYKTPDGRTFYACLSLCGYSREDVEHMIDLRIERLQEGEVDA